jgi:tetraacyldisaccharide 4'-kinase
MTNLQNIIVNQWYQPKAWGWLLWPFAVIFSYIVKLRQYLYKRKIFRSYRAPVPVVVIGNITVGGTGKTPLVIRLAAILQQSGLQPGIVLRGYKSNSNIPINVHANTDPTLVGDEAVLLAKRSKCPVIVARKRSAGVEKLLQEHKVNIVLSDDGLQHYALERDIEIAVVDGIREFGNGHSLPMGPLRELPDRLNTVDMIIKNSTADMSLQFDHVYSLLYPQRQIDLNSFVGKTVHAIAGIGTPDKFFDQLSKLGINVIPHAFADHHIFKLSDINFADRLPVLMTEKDAVKCRYFANNEHWVVTVSAVLADELTDKFKQLVQGVMEGGR